MKTVTSKVPDIYVHTIEKLVGEHAIYTSKSELIRHAIREKLMKEIEAIKNHNVKSKNVIKDNNLSKMTEKIILSEETIIQGNSKIILREFVDVEV